MGAAGWNLPSLELLAAVELAFCYAKPPPARAKGGLLKQSSPPHNSAAGSSAAPTGRNAGGAGLGFGGEGAAETVEDTLLDAADLDLGDGEALGNVGLCDVAEISQKYDFFFQR